MNIKLVNTVDLEDISSQYFRISYNLCITLSGESQPFALIHYVRHVWSENKWQELPCFAKINKRGVRVPENKTRVVIILAAKHNAKDKWLSRHYHMQYFLVTVHFQQFSSNALH